MLRIPFLRNILLSAVLLALGLPLYAVLVISPSYRQLLTEETEGEAIRYVTTLQRALDIELDETSLEPGHLPAELVDEVRLLQGDLTLVKLRVFSAHGEVVLSTEPAEIGSRNDKPYFLQQVVRGKTYSKVVSKGSSTAEGVTVERTVVETYVPLMREGVFLGAIETYFDITIGRDKIDRLARRTTLLLFGISGSMLLFIILALRTAHASMRQREAAEDALRQTNQDLEARVTSRTEQLLDSNRALTEEVTVRRRTEEALARTLAAVEQTSSRTTAILRSVPDGLLVVDARGTLLLLNPCAEEVLGLNFAEAGGQPLRKLLAAGRCDSLLATLDPQPPDVPHDLVCTCNDRTRTFQIKTSPVLAADGNNLGQIMLLHEVTRERAAQQAKHEFIAMAAHELHAPLMAVLGYADLLSSEALDGLLPEQRQEILGCIAEQARILSRLVSDLLDISRMESGQSPPLQRSLCVIEEILQAAVTAARADGRAQFELSVPPTPTALKADRGRLLQVLANLLGNAVKFSPPDTQIRIVGEVVANHYRISIVDQGSGMSVEDQQRAFETFYRGASADSGIRGSGLGLTIARTLIEAHGGDIGLDSIPGAGTRVWFTLPLPPTIHS